MSVQDYHAVMYAKYDKACKEYEYGNGGFPNVAFYLFYDEQGNQRQNGFVATDSIYNKACWAKTMKSAIAKFKTFEPSFSISK